MDIVYAIWLRSMKRFIRSRSGIVGSILMPVFVLIFLGIGLNNVVTIPGLDGDYFLFLIPGMVTMSVMFSAIGSGVQILWDRKFGFLKETLVAPVTRLEIMAGQTAGGATNAVLQGCCLLIPALFLLGLQIHNLAGVAVTLGFMVLIGFGFTAFGIAIASRTGGFGRLPADHELCHAPDLRVVGGDLPHQLAALVGSSVYPHRSADLWRGRYAVRPDGGVADPPRDLHCGDWRVLYCIDRCRGISLPEDEVTGNSPAWCRFAWCQPPDNHLYFPSRQI